MKKAVWFTFLAAIAISCLNNPDCFRLNNGEFGINFRVMGFGADNSVVDSATIEGTNIYAKSEVPSSIGLPLDPLLDSLQRFIDRSANIFWLRFFPRYKAAAQVAPIQPTSFSGRMAIGSK